MAKGKKAAAKGSEPHEKTAAATTTPPTGEKPMKKVDAVRATLAEGIESPTEGVEYIKKKFGIEMNAQSFSTSKFQINKAKGAKKKPGRKPGAAAAPKAATPAVSSNGSSCGSLVQGLRALIEKYGVEDVGEVLALMKK